MDKSMKTVLLIKKNKNVWFLYYIYTFNMTSLVLKFYFIVQTLKY